MKLFQAFLLAASVPVVVSVCDGNPHKWGRIRRCDQYDPQCPEFSVNCTTCEGIGGIPHSDKPSDFIPVKCKSVYTAAQLKKEGKPAPTPPSFPEQFVNNGFFEVQIFVKRDPLCLAQIPSMVSNGTHCYKPQEGVFNYDANQSALRIDYLKSRTPIPFTNMTEHFHHIDNCVYPEITRYGGLPKIPVCPCINVGIGPVSANWASDAQYVGRELLSVEFLTSGKDGDMMEVDHWVKGPHHVWEDVKTKQTARLWQPFNGLEVFDPTKYVTPTSKKYVKQDLRKLSLACQLGAKACINGTRL